MKLYCFLLLIILIFFVYDNKLYEGANGQYDTSEDAVVSYTTPSASDDDSILARMGLSNIIPKDMLPQELTDSTSLGVDCSKFKDKSRTCAEHAGITVHTAHDSSFNFGSGDGGHSDSKKRTCMDCLKCEFQGAFVDEFYARLCDTMAGCYDNPANYKDDSTSYAYAYSNTDWGRACRNPENLKPLQTATCQLLKNNSTLDTLLLFKKPQTAACHAEIAALQTPGVGALASLIL